MTEHLLPTVDEQQVEATGSMRRRLGRGLSALLGGTPEEHHAAPVAAPAEPQIDPSQIHLELIERNPFQPRKDFEAESLQELVDSIRQHGVLQPLLVRAIGNHYQLIAGERRLLASKQAGLESVPCRVLELDDQRVSEAALEENLKRQDLNVLEKAQAFKEYMQRFGSTMEELAKQLSMNRSTVNNYLRLLDLPEGVKESLRADRITNGHARALLSLPEADQIDLCKRIEKESLSVRATEGIVREMLGRNTPESTADHSASNSDQSTDATVPFPEGGAEHAALEMTNHVRSLQEQLQQQLGLKVEIKVTGKDTGKIVIPFGSNDDFERIVRHLRNAA